MDIVFEFTPDNWRHNCQRLVNQVYKLLPMYEKEESWEKHLDTLLLELKGYNRLFSDNSSFMVLIAKLFSLKDADNQFLFRKTIFEAISCLKEIKI